MKKTCFNNALNSCVKAITKSCINSTTSGFMFQPKTPASLKKFSKVENDK